MSRQKKSHLNKKKKKNTQKKAKEKRKEEEYLDVYEVCPVKGPKKKKATYKRKEKEKRKRRRRRRKATWTSPCAVVYGHFCPKMMSNFFL